MFCHWDSNPGGSSDVIAFEAVLARSMRLIGQTWLIISTYHGYSKPKLVFNSAAGLMRQSDRF